jgi:hypothetical protein
MSLHGLSEFDNELREVMDSDIFNEADGVERMELGYCLLSKHGFRPYFSIPPVFIIIIILLIMMI